jgi:hypothetical protein
MTAQNLTVRTNEIGRTLLSCILPSFFSATHVHALCNEKRRTQTSIILQHTENNFYFRCSHMNAWDVKPDNNNDLCALEMTQRCSATAISVSHFLLCLVRKEVLNMKTVRNNNTTQILWENLCTRSVVPIFFFFFVSLSRIQLSELLTSLYSCFLLHVTPVL